MGLNSISLLTAVLSIFVSAHPLDAVAQEAPNARFIQMNTRTFDLRVDPENLRRTRRFIPLNRAKWLGKLISEAPLLQGEVVHIRVLPQAITRLWAETGPAGLFKYTANIPEEFIFEGYETRSSTPKDESSFFFLPKEKNPSFSFTCSLDLPARQELAFCNLVADYPPDPNIYIQARIYNPDRYDDLPTSFKAIADRIRDIAYCLDVTDREPQEAPTFDSLEALQKCAPEAAS